MLTVIIALLPAWLVSVYYFGWGALLLTAVAVVSCVVIEYIIQKYILEVKTTVTDGSAAITGMLLAFNIPSNLPVWMVVLGSLVAIGVAKMSYGGLGNNPFNPALVARVFLLVSFPAQMTSWPTPQGFATKLTDAVTGATPLGIIKEGLQKGEPISNLLSKLPSYFDMFIGSMGGSLGEVSAAAIILGGIIFLIRKVITWHIPVSIILSVVVYSGIMWLVNPQQYINPGLHLLTGGLLLGAFFMATDYSTSPMTPVGMLIYGTFIGVITVTIRLFGAYPEGVSFAILIMNAFTPLINRTLKPKRFGKEVKNV
jgi:electron transport complex protein RnfD